jgi:hypothetical protein
MGCSPVLSVEPGYTHLSSGNPTHAGNLATWLQISCYRIRILCVSGGLEEWSQRALSPCLFKEGWLLRARDCLCSLFSALCKCHKQRNVPYPGSPSPLVLSGWWFLEQGL